MILFVWACIDTSKRNKAETESRRIAIAEKIREQASEERTSRYKQGTYSHSETEDLNEDQGDARLSRSSIDIGSGSSRRSISPPDSVGPSSPAPAYLSGPNTSSDSKARFEQIPTSIL